METISSNWNTLNDVAGALNYATMFEDIKFESKNDQNLDQTIMGDSKTSTSSSMSNCEATNIIDDNCELDKDFLTKKRKRVTRNKKKLLK
jgi:hypothetical protein